MLVRKIPITAINALAPAQAGTAAMRNILRAAYPRGGLSFKTAWGASQGGTQLSPISADSAGLQDPSEHEPIGSRS